MFSASTSKWAKLAKRDSSKWPEPEKSLGTLYGSKDFSSYWEAVGPAREMFDQIGPAIKKYLQDNSDDIPETVTWTIYMVGRTNEAAQPTVMFCCKDKHCRKQVRRTIEDSGILADYPGVKVGDCSIPPDCEQLVDL